LLRGHFPSPRASGPLFVLPDRVESHSFFFFCFLLKLLPGWLSGGRQWFCILAFGVGSLSYVLITCFFPFYKIALYPVFFFFIRIEGVCCRYLSLFFYNALVFEDFSRTSAQKCSPFLWGVQKRPKMEFPRRTVCPPPPSVTDYCCLSNGFFWSKKRRLGRPVKALVVTTFSGSCGSL